MIRITLPIFYLFTISLLLMACDRGGYSGGSAIPATPASLQVSSQDGYTSLQWSAVGNASSYNVYWSSQSGVTAANGNKITVSTNSMNHGGLINGQTYYYVVSASNAGGESAVSAQAQGSPVDGNGSGDTLFSSQWHLYAAASQGTNVQPAWSISCPSGLGCRGEGVRVAVVDDGIEVGHKDLLANVATGLSYNYVTGSNDPSPSSSSDAHGTAVAGIIAARDFNDEGVRGMAPRANLVGYNLLNYYTLSNETDAMTRDTANMYVSSNSWGTADNTGELENSTTSWKTAITSGLANGRNGKGTVYVFAAGNGGQYEDNSNYDGYANHYGVIAVTALNNSGTRASYAEPGANILISAPGGEFCTTTTITTTDLSGTAGFNSAGASTISNSYTELSNDDYTQCMNGTSAATPMVSGAVALLLQRNPNLGWRDVHYILATTARKNDSADAGWTTNGAGYPIHHSYGFGALDVSAAITAANGWTNLGSLLSTEKSGSPNIAIPDNNATGVSDDISISGSGISEIEFVEVTFSAADHSYFGDLEIKLIRQGTPSTESILAQQHSCYEKSGASYTTTPCTAKYASWTFGSVRHLGEPADGTWRLSVADKAAGDTGTFQSWTLKIYGH